MKSTGCLWNGLTLLMLGLTMLTCMWVGAVFVNPQGPFNPFKPTLAGVPQSTEAPEIRPATQGTEEVFPTLPPEWTVTFTPAPETSATPRPTNTRAARTPTATEAFTPIGPTPTETETTEPTITPSPTARPPQPTQPPGGYPGTAVPTQPPGGYP